MTPVEKIVGVMACRQKNSVFSRCPAKFCVGFKMELSENLIEEETWSLLLQQPHFVTQISLTLGQRREARPANYWEALKPGIFQGGQSSREKKK